KSCRTGKAADGQRHFALMPRDTKYSRFGAAVSAALAERQISQADLAQALGRSPAYLNQTMTGTKPASAAWVDLVADTLKPPLAKRTEPHAAAARDQGFKLDLTPPSRNK